MDCGVGNLKSVLGIFKLAAGGNGLAADVLITSDFKQMLNCDRIVLSGVGSFADCYKKLCGLHNMMDALDFAATVKCLPILGISVGMQLMASVSLEETKTGGFNWIPGVVTRLSSERVRVPHIGWNGVCAVQKHYLFSNLPAIASKYSAYFAHSYKFEACDTSSVIATTCYDEHVTASVARHNIIGVQFRPEKSLSFGVAFCRNFLSWQVSF